jgi:membrane fusion protein, multidrug efflux system
MAERGRGRRAAAMGLMLVLALAAAGPKCQRSDQAKNDAPATEAAIKVRAEHPAPRSMEEVIEVHGNLDPVEQVDVVCEVSGTIVAINVQAGDPVDKGQLLAKIDDQEYQLNLRQAETALSVARSDYNSTKVLFDQGMKSKQEMEKIKRAYDDAQTNHALSRRRLDRCEIKSPLKGVVVARKAEVYHQAGAMEVLFTIADLSSYIVKITVTEGEVAKLRVGQPVRVRVDALTAAPEEFPLAGTVKRIQPKVDPQTGTVEVEVAIEGPGPGARVGMFTRLRIVTAVHENALVISRRALSGEGGDMVWVIDGEHGRLTEIKTGLIDQTGIEVLAGLSPEDQVITDGYAALTEKSRIEIVAADPAQGAPPPPEKK